MFFTCTKCTNVPNRAKHLINTWVFFLLGGADKNAVVFNKENEQVIYNLAFIFCLFNQFSPVLRFVWKPVICFALQKKWLVSIWNATLGWNELIRYRDLCLEWVTLKEIVTVSIGISFFSNIYYSHLMSTFAYLPIPKTMASFTFKGGN